MEYKEAARILEGMLVKYQCSEEEKQAITTAIGMLSWGALGQSRAKLIREKRKKETGKGW